MTFSNKKYIFLIFMFFLSQLVCIVNSISVVFDVSAADVPNDDGSSIQLKWKNPANIGLKDIASYEILRSELLGEMKSVGKADASSDEYIDSKLERNKAYYYIIRAKEKSGKSLDSAIIGPVIPT
ncbi:MAG: hypothetical protein ACPL7B_17820, partial [Candidatus Poribacteria bacterium]